MSAWHHESVRATVLVVTLFAADAVLACSVCITAAGDIVLPPIRAWSLFAAVWFTAHGALRS